MTHDGRNRTTNKNKEHSEKRKPTNRHDQTNEDEQKHLKT